MPPTSPLRGIRVLVTRARPQAAGFVRRLQDAGAEVVELPTIAIRDPDDWSPVDAAIARLSGYSMVIFTSVNGVERFLARLRTQGRGEDALRGRHLVAIGPATAAALEEHGMPVEAVPDEYRGEAVLQVAEGLLGLADGRRSADEIRVLIPRARQARDVLPDGLRGLGAIVDVVPVYRTIMPEGGSERLLEVLRAGVDCVTFTSSSTVRNFVRMAGAAGLEALRRGVAVACIGPISAGTAREAGISVAVEPDEYTVDGLCQALAAFYGDGRK